MAITYVASGTAVGADSLAIPVGNLSGFDSLADFQDSLANINNARLLVAFLEKSYSIINATNFRKLGITLTKTITASATTTFNLALFNFAISLQKYVEQDTAPTALPLPTSGANLGLGDFDLITIFAGAAKVASGANTAADSVVIPVSDLTPYGSPAYGSINLASGQDNRGLWMALVEYLIDKSSVRSTTNLSSITSVTVNTPTVPTVPANYISTTDPLTGINSALLYGQAFITQQVLTVSVEMIYTSSTLMMNVNNA